MTGSATCYESTDQASAAQLDATYPPAYLGDAREHTDYVPIEPPEDTGRFGDMSEPQERLRDVKDYTDELNGSPGWWEASSPMAMFGAAIEATSWIAVQLGWREHPFDLQAEVVKPFVGDWAGVRAAADVFGDLSNLCRTTAINVNWASQGTEEVWQGRAGEGCALHLMNAGRSVHEARKPLDELSKQYKTASEEMVTFRDAVVNVINEIGDAAISAAAAGGIAGGAASTGFGAPVAVLPALYAGWKIERVLNGITRILDLIGKFEAATSVAQCRSENPPSGCETWTPTTVEGDPAVTATLVLDSVDICRLFVAITDESTLLINHMTDSACDGAVRIATLSIAKLREGR